MPTDEALDFVERRIRDAIERGEFDHLKGEGKPIPDVDRPYEPGWWARQYVDRMRSQDALREIRETVRRERPVLETMSDREAARRRVAEINAIIDEVNSRVDESDRIDTLALAR